MAESCGCRWLDMADRPSPTGEEARPDAMAARTAGEAGALDDDVDLVQDPEAVAVLGRDRATADPDLALIHVLDRVQSLDLLKDHGQNRSLNRSPGLGPDLNRNQDLEVDPGCPMARSPGQRHQQNLHRKMALNHHKMW